MKARRLTANHSNWFIGEKLMGPMPSGRRHTPLDIWLVCPDGKAAKPWLTIVIDDYSRAVAGYFLSFEAPSSLHTSLALRQAIWRKRTRAGLCVASRTSCTPIMEATSRPIIWSR